MALELIGVVDNLCTACRNWFTPDTDRLTGTYKIENGELDLSEVIAEGQYFRITGSTFNDGVHQYPCVFEHDETFDGCVWCMKVPAEVLSACEDILTWREKYDGVANSPYTSESFGGYTYSKPDAASAAGWEGAFSDVIKRWRKIR